MIHANKRSWINYKSTVSWLIVSIIFLTAFLSAAQNVNADALQVTVEPMGIHGPVYLYHPHEGVILVVHVTYGGNPVSDATVAVLVTRPDLTTFSASVIACDPASYGTWPCIPGPGLYTTVYPVGSSPLFGVYRVTVKAEPPQYCVVPCPTTGASTGTAQNTFTVVPETTTTTAGSQTDWAITSVSLSPPAPHVGDQVTFSMVLTALSSPGSFPQSVNVGCMIDSTVCGTGTLSYPGPIGVPFTVTAQTPWTATLGTHTLTWGVTTIPAGLDPNPSNNMMSKQFTVAPQVQFDFSISASPSSQTISPGGSTSYTVTVNLVSGTAQSVTLGLSGAPSGMSGSFNPTSGTPTFSSTLSVTAASSASPGTVTLTITGTGGGVTHSATATLTVSQAPDFRIDVSPPSQTVLQGQTVSYAVNVAGLNGFNSQVSLAIAGLPSGVGGTFSVPSSTPDYSSTLAVTIPSNSPTGSFTLTITGNGGGINRVANIVLTINQVTQIQTSTASQTSNTQTPSTSDLMGLLQQNSLLVIGVLVILVLIFAVLAMRGRGRRSVPQQMAPTRTFCSKCGAENPIANEFCGYCGDKLKRS